MAADPPSSPGEGTFRGAWRAAVASPRRRVLAFTSVPFLIGVLLVFRRFLDLIEARPGAALHDPLLALFAPHDVALVVFPVMYLTMIALFVGLARHPVHFITGVWAYALMLLFRMAVMFLLPLDPPPTMIALRDPLVELFGQQQTLTRDLFFSGHTATLAVLTFAAPTLRLRALGCVALFVVASGVLLQHAHYAVDVAAAPFFAYGAYRLARAAVGPPA